METLSFLDILKVFSNPINEEQAWAVCFQCANFLLSNHNQELFQQLLDHGIRCVCLNKHGEVLLRNPPDDKDESENVKTKERLNPRRSSSFNQASSDRSRYQVIATERDAIQALGMAVFEALDYGIDPSEERQLSHDLESLISSLTSAKNSLEYDPEASNADDEGIEKDADVECQCTLEDVLKKCSQHLSTKQNAHHHYKAVCRALFTEAGELMTFLDKISTGKEKLLETQNENSRKLEELQRADWACLWSQVMKSLRQGVLLKKVEHVNLPPVEYELTPFEMLLEDIRSRRYTLHKIMVDGNIPSKVKNDAHAVILDFIRSRPPLKKVNERQLKPRVSTTLDLHESLLKEIRSRPKLRPTRDGKLVVETSRSRLSSDNETEPPLPVKKILKPDFSLFLNNSFEESSGDENHSPEHSLTSPVSDVSFVSGTITPPSPTWFKVENTFWQDNNSQRLSRLQRRHTIMVCESPVDGKVAGQALPPLEEVEEPPLMKESHHLNCRSLMKPLQQLGTPTTYYSLKDNSRNVVLRSLSSQQIRSLLENQQSLTNLTTQLFAIQELEDDPLKPNSSMKQTASTLSKAPSHALAPPPNPSLPFRSQKRSSFFSMSMFSIKSMNRSYCGGSQIQHANLFSQPTPLKTTVAQTSTSISTKPACSPPATVSPINKVSLSLSKHELSSSASILSAQSNIAMSDSSQMKHELSSSATFSSAQSNIALSELSQIFKYPALID